MFLTQDRFIEISSAWPIFPFACAAIASIPIFKPEIPHGNLVIVSMVWSVLALITVWVHKTPVISPNEDSPAATHQAQIEFAKEQSTFWRTLLFGLLASYLAILVGSAKEVHHFNNDLLVKDAGETFLLNMNGTIQIGLMSLFVLVGPGLELGRKYLSANRVFLNITKINGVRLN